MNLLSYIKGDRVIWVVALLLSVVSTWVVYSSVVAIAYRYRGGNTEYYLFKHIIILACGFLLIYFTHNIRYTYYSRLSQIAVFLAIPLLLFTLVKGVSSGGALRWLEIPGTGLTIQTSDFAKLALIVYLARILTIKQEQINDFRSVFVPVVLPVVLTCGLILPSNFSTAAILFTTCLVLIFIGRINFRYILLLIGIGIASIALLLLLVYSFPHISNRTDTWKARIENYISGKSEQNYQAEQAMIAIATGGPLGKGPGKSDQRNFLPQASTDFIYAIIIEEYGSVIGGSLMLLLYLILLYRAVRIATRSRKTFGSLLAIGLTFSLVFQAMINMAVAVRLFPVTGQPLPLVSMGGTSIWFTSVALGIVLSVSREFETGNKGSVEAA